MGEVIKCWLRQRLGAIIDITPNVFGHYTRDGTLLAKLLYNYGIINETQLKTIVPTQDPALARVNLKNLRAWIKFIGIELNDNCIEDISHGKGVTSLKVFYNMFFCLETKDRLHFITLQKERKKYIPTSRKFDVKAISEEALIAGNNYSEFTPLNTVATVIDWHRKKFLQLLKDYKHQREQLHNDNDTKPIDNKCNDKKSLGKSGEIIDVTVPDKFIDNDATGENVSIDVFKQHKAHNLAAEFFKSQTQADFLCSVWENINDHQNKLIDKIIARKILKEAEYERQIIEKIQKIRQEEDWISKNRRLVESLMQKAKESNIHWMRLEDGEISRNKKRLFHEEQRLVELHRILARAKLDKTEEYLNEMGRLITKDLAEMATCSADHKNLFGYDVPREIWREWKSLFIKGLSLIHCQEIYEFGDVYDESQYDNNEQEDESGEEEKERDEEQNIVISEKQISMEVAEYFDENDLEDYINLREPWINFIPQISEEAEIFLKLGNKVLGDMINKILVNVEESSCDFSTAPIGNFAVRSVVLGVTDEFPINLLQNHLNKERIQIIDVTDAINYCLNSYNRSEYILQECGHDNSRTASLIGAAINELLIRGEEISNDLIVKAVTEYISVFKDICGWVIINYPSSHGQMMNFEATLAGRPLNSHKEDFSKYSKIFPNLSNATEHMEMTRSYLTSFIRLKLKIETSNAETNIDQEENKIDEFYMNQPITSVFEYSIINEDTLHKLCELILANHNGTIMPQTVENNHSSTDKSKELINETELTNVDVPRWMWMNFPQGSSKESLQRLASAWETQEESYIKILIEALSLRRFIFLTIIPYTSLIIRYMWEYMNRVDEKRNEMLKNFRKAFNEIPLQLRDDCKVKCELHCRVKDFQTQLWKICDARRRKSRAKVEAIIQYHWASTQVIIVTNIYVSLLQAEMDRFVNTLSTIEGCYSLICGKNGRNDCFSKPVLKKFHADFNKSCVDDEIEGILLNKNEMIDLSETLCFKLIEDNIKNCQSIVNNYFHSSQKLLTESTKSQKPVEKPKQLLKNTKQTKINGNGKISIDKDTLENIAEECSFVLRYEFTRMNNVLHMLISAWQADVNFLLTTVKQSFIIIEENINELYKNELKNTNEIMRVFCLAIEHEKPIVEEIAETMQNDIQLPTEVSEYYRFKMSQIGKLKDIFKRVAPSGIICERAFKYIVEDMIDCLPGEFDGESLLPDSWLKLQPRQITKVINKLFGNTSHINWRDFLIYAMDIAMPTQDQLLDTLEAFKKKDKDLLGIVSKSIFHSLALWFDDVIITPSISSWLHEDYEWDEDYCNSDKNSEGSSALGVPTRKKSISFKSDSLKRKHLFINDVTSEEIRLNLLKELLGEIFIEDGNYVNYLKLLLCFCKNEDPRQGLANALSITLNCRVSFDIKEGEEYVKQLIKEKANGSNINQELANMISRILHETINDIFDYSKNLVNYDDDDNASIIKGGIDDRKSFPIFIEKLDKPTEKINPTSLIMLNDTTSSTSIETATDRSSIASVVEMEQLSQYQSTEVRAQCYWISTRAFEKLLWDLTPRLMEQSNLFGNAKSLMENLKSVYDEITCSNIQSEHFLIYKLINSEFVLIYLQNTSQFIWKSLKDIVKDVQLSDGN